MKLGIISIALPPSQSGQSIALFQLLKNFKAESYCLITQKNINLYNLQGNCLEKLPAKYHFIQPDNQITQRIIQGILFLRFERFLNVLLNVRKLQIKKILKKELCDIAIACTGDLLDPPATFLACKELGIPFVLYTFDYYSHQWTHPPLRSFAEKYEKEIITGAQEIIVPNECMSEEYRKKYGAHATVVHNPFDLIEYEKNASIHKGKEGTGGEPEEINIVYTGAIYDAHFTAFHNLIAAIEKMGIRSLKLHIYTPQSISYLKKNNITGPVEIHKHLPNNQMPGIQRDADILFLPLAFNSDIPAVIRTSAPGKIGEYLAAKKPILVHAPPESFISWYFRKYNCGCVVDEDDPKKLAMEITRILRDPEKQKIYSENAYSRAKEDFDLPIAQKRFNNLFNI
jgi:glycosyltransferase involved in cell wall biosynthesis